MSILNSAAKKNKSVRSCYFVGMLSRYVDPALALRHYHREYKLPSDDEDEQLELGRATVIRRCLRSVLRDGLAIRHGDPKDATWVLSNDEVRQAALKKNRERVQGQRNRNRKKKGRNKDG